MTAPTELAGNGRDQLPLSATTDVDGLSQREGGSSSTTTSLVEKGGAPSAPGVVGSEPAPAEQPLVIGLDVSITSTGVAGATWADTLRTWSLPRKGATRADRWARMCAAREQILPFIDGAALVVQESPAYSTGDMPGSQDLAWLWWSVYARCAAREIPWVEVGTSTLKVYATGNGRASKEDVVQAVATRRRDVTFRGNDQADALMLAAMGLDTLGYPPVELPKTHRRALASVQWPVLA